ncbi:MAG: BrnA antitoxin family protein [Rhodoferax sp.]|uniref:BrnA antitoxin family protein n=1 Tax=Rhodoferax sp. TaxID=50421 RepID=UPI003BB69CE7|nr:BrnA antitoxin family protein [Rhodoferax sp.]
MPKTVKTRSGRVLALPTLAEDATIAAGIAQDPDTYEPSDLELGLMRRPGRPMGSGTKRQITLRLDADLIDTFKASGDGWQTRINAVLRDAVAHGVVKQ